MARKKADKYIYSTLSANMDYTGYSKGADGTPIAEKHVRIAGGANVADGHFVTQRGVVTGVTDDELEFLMSNPVFLLHKENGFIVISSDEPDPEVVVADMRGADASAPLTPNDTLDGEPTPALNTSRRKA